MEYLVLIKMLGVQQEQGERKKEKMHNEYNLEILHQEGFKILTEVVIVEVEIVKSESLNLKKLKRHIALVMINLNP